MKRRLAFRVAEPGTGFVGGWRGLVPGGRKFFNFSLRQAQPRRGRAPFFSSVQTPCLPFRAEKFPRGEHPEIIDSLAKERSKIPAIQREKHIGARERRAEHRLVLCDLKKQRPIKSQFVILDNESVLEINPSVGCRMRQTSQILAHFPQYPRGNHQLPILRSREFENEPRRARF